MNKKQMIRTLENIALYMELLGENHFKVAAFRKAANVLEVDERSLEQMDDLFQLKGIGKGTGAVLQDLLDKGESDLFNQLKEEVPASLVELLRIPGLGGKRIAKLREALGIESIDQLKVACEREEVSQLPGFGKKTENNFLQEIAQLGQKSDRLPRWQLEETVNEVENLLASIPQVNGFLVTGSYRRVEETSSDLDFIVVATDRLVVREQIMHHLPVKQVIGAGETKVSVTVETDVLVDIDFRFVESEQFATAIHHFTGSKEHNVRLRQLAKERGEKISEYGVEQTDGTIKTFESETAFFAHFNLPFIPPAMRRNGSEIDHVAQLDRILTPAQIRSDLHMHTTWSDGAHSIEEMAEAARAKGYTHIAITDHSQYLQVANGLSVERVKQQMSEIRELNKKWSDFTVFCGIELDILPDATLDFPDEVLRELDFVNAAIHSSFQQSEEQIMKRLHTALKNPYITSIAHPTGRIIGKRPGYAVNMAQLIEWAVKYDTALEINANPYRFDLATEYVQQAVAAGVKISINTDAHSVEQLDYMQDGVFYAQKAYLPTNQVINTWSLEKFQQVLVNPRRSE